MMPKSLLKLLEEKYSKYWWSSDEEALYNEAMSDLFKSLIFTILSQNTSSKNTYKAYLGLKAKFKINPITLASANEKDLSEAIKSGGLYKVKAERIKKLANIILEKYNGELTWIYLEPKNIVREKLLELPGVGNKTVDVLLSRIHGYRESIVVDTHMRRIALRLGLVKKNASYREVQNALKNFFPWNAIKKEEEEKFIGLFWILAKYICKARNPKCKECVLNSICKKSLIHN